MVVLGPVTLSGFEVPERIAVGGKQRLSVHELPGGSRVVDVLGASDEDMKWSGVMSGPYAEERVRLLDSLRRGGRSWPLIWSGWRFTVIVKRFQAAVTAPFLAPYQISCSVLAEGDAFAAELFPALPSLAEAQALSPLMGVALDESIDMASTALSSRDLPGILDASGQLARSVVARAFLGALNISNIS